MNPEEIVDTLNTDPFVQRLLQARIPARIAYTGLDKHPRVVPLSHLWNGEHYVRLTAHLVQGEINGG